MGLALGPYPLEHYVPPLLGVGALDVKQVSGLTAVQILIAASAGAWTHGRRNLVHRPLAIRGGIAMAVGSLIGSVGSHFVSGRLLLLVFAAMTTLAVPLMFIPPGNLGEWSAPESVSVSLAKAMPAAAIIGCLAGFVGAGGAFLLMPVMIGLLRVPVRIGIATSLVMTAAAAAVGLVGKVSTGQVPFGPASAVAVGSIIGGVLGARVSRSAPVALLRGVLAALVALVALRVWSDVLSP